jgi:hypothetical protein
MTWADEHAVSYLAWGWIVLSQEEKDGEGCSAFYLIEDASGTPAPPNGTALHDHLLTLAPGGVIATGAGTTPTGGGSTTTTGTTNGGTVIAPSGGQRSEPPVTLTGFTESGKSNGRSIGFTLRSAQSCTGVLSGQTVVSYEAASANRRKRHPVSLGTVHFILQAGKSKTIVLTLAKPARKLLAARHTLKAQITITLTSAGHEVTVVHRTVTLKAPAKR